MQRTLVDISSTVKKAHFFFIVDGGLFLELLFLLQLRVPPPYHWILAVPVLLAALLNLAFLGIFETTLTRLKGLRNADAVRRCGTIPEKVALLDIWLQLGKLRLGVFVAAMLANCLTIAYLYDCLLP